MSDNLKPRKLSFQEEIKRWATLSNTLPNAAMVRVGTIVQRQDIKWKCMCVKMAYENRHEHVWNMLSPSGYVMDVTFYPATIDNDYHPIGEPICSDGSLPFFDLHPFIHSEIPIHYENKKTDDN